MTRARCALAALLIGLAPAALGGEMLVQGEVVDVVQIRADPSSGDCQPPRPPPGARLRELLAWDLRLDCGAGGGPAVEAYRVYYRWDGRTYSRIMDHRPGSTLTLRVRLD